MCSRSTHDDNQERPQATQSHFDDEAAIVSMGGRQPKWDWKSLGLPDMLNSKFKGFLVKAPEPRNLGHAFLTSTQAPGQEDLDHA